MTKIEKQKFTKLQQHLKKNWSFVEDDYEGCRTLVMIASFSLDPEELRKVFGIEFYEERLLYFIGLLKNPNTKIIYISSLRIDPVIVDYYLTMYSDSSSQKKDMKSRLVMLQAGDSGSYLALTQKVLKNKKLIKEIKDEIPNKKQAVLRCFNSTQDEEDLAVKLGVPLFAPSSKLVPLGSKSGSRETFKAAGVKVPPGVENIMNEDGLIKALRSMKRRNPKLQKVILKFNYSFSGGGNAILNVAKLPGKKEEIIKYVLRYLRPIETDLLTKKYLEKLFKFGGIVEEWMMGAKTDSPSAQLNILPNKKVELISTHEQLLDEETQQTYLGCRFPAKKSNTKVISQAGMKIGNYLAKKGVIGRFAIDFVVNKSGNRTDVRAIEINLRKGGTTHPYFMTKLITGAKPDKNGMLRIDGRRVFYYAFDNIKHPEYAHLDAKTLIEIVHQSGLEYDPETQTGIVLHLLGAIKTFHKFGAVCIARSPKAAEQLYFLLIRVVNKYLEEKQEVKVKKEDTIVNKNRLVETFGKLVRIDSPPGEEKLLSDALFDKFKSLGFKTTQDEFWNILVKIPGRGNIPFLLSAHMDVVQPCRNVQPVVRGDKIMSAGDTVLGADDKAAIAYILELVNILEEQKIPHRPLELLFTVREETFFGGVLDMDTTKITSPMGYVIDGAKIGEIDISAPWLMHMKIEVKGKAAHSGVNPEEGINAIKIASEAISKIPLGRIDSETTANIGTIKGGHALNTVPNKVEIVAEARSLDRKKLEEQVERMTKAFEDAAEKHHGIVQIETKIPYDGYVFDKEDVFIQKTADIMKKAGITPEVRKAMGGSDANELISKGIKVLDIGTGMEKPHTTKESIAIPEMIKMVKFLLEAVRI
ncbi:M20/M25/M40 family metallo-hydrolase [Patescibacteria group bacterium]|nr:M20/M25/M40 family metallo-hydrolase [Patescibacteria group bacterium]MBU1673627.1 M20/M25/M40 family metallo-hydrolase [Patescibacteria group bacterium]MBU1963885.1 M20/M25/M40 family metallo-hydrolase [Patescibacteria group bacterium]